MWSSDGGFIKHQVTRETVNQTQRKPIKKCTHVWIPASPDSAEGCKFYHDRGHSLHWTLLPYFHLWQVEITRHRLDWKNPFGRTRLLPRQTAAPWISKTFYSQEECHAAAGKYSLDLDQNPDIWEVRRRRAGRDLWGMASRRRRWCRTSHRRNSPLGWDGAAGSEAGIRARGESRSCSPVRGGAGLSRRASKNYFHVKFRKIPRNLGISG